MELFTVWNGHGLRIGIDEKCLLRDDGNYIGIKTGYIYHDYKHYHSKQIKAKIISVDETNKTGMYHLCEGWDVNTEENRTSWKRRYIDCYVTLEEAHYANGLKIYRCLELDDYFSENEVKVIE